MKKTPVQLRFDAAKLKALEYYLPQAGTTVEQELQKRFDELYDNEVPQDVKNFLKFQDGEVSADKKMTADDSQEEKSSDGKPAKKQKQSAPKAESAAPSEAPAPVQTM
ncbi:MAG: hypothetical protein PHV32_00520 [Eubacteriales bacterium]|nr:hypothetical protein [Eubacteriales bacterium]